MSAKNLDKHNRWRNKTVAFRVSPEEDSQIETAVKLTGLTKQDYIIRRLLCQEVPSSIMRKFVYKSGKTKSAQGQSYLPLITQ